MKLSEIFLKDLRDSQSEIHSIAYHLFSCMNEESLDDLLNFLKDDIKNNEHWLHDFHKSMRQTDFFDSCFHRYRKSFLSKSEKEEYERLKKLLGARDIFIPSEESAIANNLGEEYKMWKYLRNLDNKREEESITGHLDMIFWNLLHLDRENKIGKFIVRFFKEVEEELS